MPHASCQRPSPASRRMGQHHRISGKYLDAYAGEIVSREDTCPMPNGKLHALAIGAALGHPVSRVWKGYWQRGQSS